jgi:uncharacterized protein
MNKLIPVLFTALIFVLIDFYAFQAIKVAIANSSILVKRIVTIFYWSVTLFSIAGLVAFRIGDPEMFGRKTRTFIITGIASNYLIKFFMIFFLLVDDIVRVFRWIGAKISSVVSSTPPVQTDNAIPRSEFLVKTGLALSAIPFVGITYGIISGAHDYRVRRKTITLNNLPKAFDGIKIAQISDIHSGSFFNKTAVKGGVEMLLKERPDLVFFTGDLVNDRVDEFKDYFDIFKKIKAPLGVYSTLGNHDYGPYAYWPSKEAQIKNLQTLIQTHKDMGWNILMNEHKFIKEGGEEIAIIGIENWGAGRWPKIGRMDLAHAGTERAPVKLLLSHDPSHWDAQVRPQYPDVDITFSGHTHGFQFGVEVGDFKWSPSQYVYKQWAGLYQEGEQYLYVNRGYGYLGFPGRIGMPPEITIIELKSPDYKV